MGGKAIREGIGTVAKLLGAGIMEREGEREKYRQRIEEIKLNKTLSDDSYEPVIDPTQASPSDIVANGVRYRKKSAMERIREQINNMQTINAELPPNYESGIAASGKPYVRPKSQRTDRNKLTYNQALNFKSDPMKWRQASPEDQAAVESVLQSGRQQGNPEQGDPVIAAKIKEYLDSGIPPEKVKSDLQAKGIDPSLYGL